MNSELHRFGIDPNSPPDAAQWRGVCKLLTAIVTNPHLEIGDRQSLIAFPPSIIPKGRGGGAAAATTGAFYKTYTIASEDATNGDIYLQGGQVSAGTGTDAVADFLLYDASADTWAGTAGQHLLLTITGDGEAADDVLMPVFNMTSVSAPTPTTGIGSNTLPEIGSLTGRVCLVSLGVFQSAGFLPASPGNIQVSFCFGGYTVSRF